MYSKLNNTYSNSDEYDSEPWKCGDKWKKPPDNWTGTCQNDPQHTIYAQRDDSTNWGICSNASCPQNQEPIIFDDKTKKCYPNTTDWNTYIPNNGQCDGCLFSIRNPEILTKKCLPGSTCTLQSPPFYSQCIPGSSPPGPSPPGPSPPGPSPPPSWYCGSSGCGLGYVAGSTPYSDQITCNNNCKACINATKKCGNDEDQITCLAKRCCWNNGSCYQPEPTPPPPKPTPPPPPKPPPPSPKPTPPPPKPTPLPEELEDTIVINNANDGTFWNHCGSEKGGKSYTTDICTIMNNWRDWNIPGTVSKDNIQGSDFSGWNGSCCIYNVEGKGGGPIPEGVEVKPYYMDWGGSWKTNQGPSCNDSSFSG